MSTTTFINISNTGNDLNIDKFFSLVKAVTVTATATALIATGFQQGLPQFSTTTKTSISPILTISDHITRETTQQEKLIAEIRSWNLLDNNWDGENAVKPSEQSIKESVSFVTLLKDNIIFPEPMLLSSGHVALFWNEDNLYADIEFLGDERIAYFIKKNGEKYKGVFKFKSQQMPPVFSNFIKD